MARRALPEINAGSMADIAFLLLIFWLVTTTIDSDEGIQRQLPPIVPPVENPPVVKQRNIYVVLVNGKDQLLVEDELMEIGQLKEGAKEFLIANGDGITYPSEPEIEDFPIRQLVSKADVDQQVANFKQFIEQATTDADKDRFEKELKKWERKQMAIKHLGGDYYELPGAALISMQNDNNTSYNMYIQVQNELQAAVNELRDELALSKFQMTYDELKTAYERDKENKTYEEWLHTVRAVYPQRISEAEPNDAGNNYN
ncbi:MAG: biopolymer transporter ExbD [Flavobacteriales bacterium]|nr:biopolymer transporter ExbD [Flavobacteriales bacterium]